MPDSAATAAISNLQTAQAVELQTLLTSLRGTDSSTLSAYIGTNRDALVNDVLSQRSDAFNKVYSDSVSASNTQNSIMYYLTRNQDFNNMQKELLNRSEYDAQSVVHDKDLAQRQYEINEWSYGNKRDTLFILQMILVALLLLSPLLYFSRQGIVPSSVLTGVGVLFAIIIALTIAVRAQYTIYSRDQRYWNRRQFDKKGGPPIPTPSCEAVAQAYTSGSDALQNAATALGDNTIAGYSALFSTTT